MPGSLYLVATPIGNLADITYRAVQVLKDVDVVACEDTRHTHKLLRHYGISTKTISYHEHNEEQRAAELVSLLQNGKSVAVVSDAGTPGISDPGFRLVSKAVAEGIAVVPIPGPSALISALIASGLPTDEFLFAGFLSARAGQRRTRLGELRNVPATLIFYEAPHRVAAMLNDCLEVLGEREAAVARELTKIHEEIRRGRLSELQQHYSNDREPRGEFVVVVDRNEIGGVHTEESLESVSSVVARLESEGLDHRAALKKAARELGLSRAEAYRRLVADRSRE
jgi:16S rRNA (cytidine1402-2'-O)-methyltransferase